MESQMTRPYGHEQTEEPIRIHHPEEEEHQEKGATKVLKKMKEKVKKIKNSFTKHGQGHEHNHDADEEENEYEEPEVHDAPVYESFAVRGGVTGQPESLSHPGETNIPAPEEIIPPGTKVFPVVSSDYTKPIEPEPVRDTYGYETLSDPVRTTDTSVMEERKEKPSHNLKVSYLSDRGESREAHHQPIDTPVFLPSATEDVTRTFTPCEGGQRKVNIEKPKELEEDPAAPGGGSDYLSGVSNYQSKVTDPTHRGGEEIGVRKIPESLGRMKVADESHDKKSGDLQTRSREYYQENDSGIDKNSPTRSYETDHKTESGTDKDYPTGFHVTSGAELGKDFPTRSHEFDQKNASGMDKSSPSGLGSGSIGGLTDDFPARSPELGLKTDSGIGKDSQMANYEYGLEKNLLPAGNDDVKVETAAFGRDLPTGTHDQFSPELSRPKEREDFNSKAEGTRDETHETKPSTYTDKISSATSVITEKAIAAKNIVASKLGYSGETGGEKHESSVVDETPRSATGYGQKVAGTVAEKLTPVYEKVKETGSTLITKLPLSGGGSGAVEAQPGEGKGVPVKDYLAEKLRPGDEDKALSEMIAEKLHLGGGEKKTTPIKETEVTAEKIPTNQISKEKEHGVVTEEETTGGGMVGKIKDWFGGKPEEKSSISIEESSQSLGSTVGTMGSDSSDGRDVPVQGGLHQSEN